MALELYRAWKNKNKSVGCVFARLLAVAKSQGRFGYRAEQVEGSNARALATEVDQRVTDGIAAQGVNGLALVLPGVGSLNLLVDVVSELSGKEEWAMERSLLLATPVGEAVAFRISRAIPFEEGTIQSEMLVLGPFPQEFPNTRCAPVTAFEIYVGVPPPPVDFMGTPTKKGHLALIKIDHLNQEAIQNLAKETKAIRLESLGGIDDPRAKAKVSFSVPMSVASALGCVP